MTLNRKQKAQLGVVVGVIALFAVGLALKYNGLIFSADEYNGTPTITLPVNNERFVYMNTPLIQGVSSQGSTVTIKEDNNTIGTVTADASGKFFYKPTEGFADGTHIFVVNDSISGRDSKPTYVNFDSSDSSKAILKAQGTNIAENDHPYFGNGTNQYDAIVKMMGDPNAVEADFTKAEKAGVKMIRIINYMLDDMALPNPTSAPQVSVSDGGTLPAGNYIYRYSCVNLSKNRFAYNPAETMPSSATSVNVNSNQTVTLTLSPCAKSYRYYIYRRLSTDPPDSEKYLGEVSKEAGTTATFTDSGTATLDINRSIPTQNQTINNPRTRWPTDQSTAFMTGFGNWNENALVATDKVMELARKHNIRILFTFVDQHDNNTGGVREIARNCGVENSAFFSDSCSKNMYQEIIDKFTKRTNTVTGVPYKDDPAIFAWEFINEPYETGGGYGFRSWINEMGTYLKNNDPNHMLSSGDDGSVWFTHGYEPAYNANNNHDFVSMGLPDSIDILSFHGYPESDGFVFNHGYYGEFDPTDPAKREGLSDAAAAAWLDKWGPVRGAINIAGATKEMERRAHYAYLLNKPVIFGEWGLNNWQSSTANDWVSELSNAILTIKPDLIRGTDVIPDGDFSDNLTDNWIIDPPNTAYFEKDESVTYNGHPSAKLTPTHIVDSAQAWQYRTGVNSKKIPIKPNTTYWYEYTYNNPTNKNLEFTGTYFKNGQSLNQSFKASVGTTIGWSTVTRLNGMRCEFTTPDADELELSINLVKGREVDGDITWIGDINLFELVSPATQNVGSTFASTGWWGIDLDYSMDSLVTAAKNFATASTASLPSLYESGDEAVVVDDNTPDDNNPVTDTTDNNNNTNNNSGPSLVAQDEDTNTGEVSNVDGDSITNNGDTSVTRNKDTSTQNDTPSASNTTNSTVTQGHENLAKTTNAITPAEKDSPKNVTVVVCVFLGLVVASIFGFYLYKKREVTKDL